ncbi:Bgt-50970 [Blumeria graminis f. sp. tritici]|uniref:Bgt-50970 n=1 Tax=Blumeria graminis f. sp. tritici TaxID=62690 RepID=A0A9X9L9N2_BLUGR|nr:Bgt-50970 [Blumeria graminis f. sp. tritici]
MAIIPCGRAIYSSGTILDFVAGIRDAIKGHEGLVGKGILHGDVCEEKIVLLKTTSDKDMHGMLTGLEHSVKIKDNLAMDYEHFLTGNLKFMALERLKNFSLTGEVIRRTCRHDLESFFYVFIVGCIGYEKVSESKDNNLERWCSKNLAMNYMSKVAEVMNSDILLDKFTPSFEGLKELARNLRQILFNDNGQYIETPEDCRPLYQRMIKAFDKTIEDIRGTIFL